MISLVIALLLAIAAGPLALAVLLAVMFSGPALALVAIGSVAGEYAYEAAIAATVVIPAYFVVCMIDDWRGEWNLRRAE